MQTSTPKGPAYSADMMASGQPKARSLEALSGGCVGAWVGGTAHGRGKHPIARPSHPALGRAPAKTHGAPGLLHSAAQGQVQAYLGG